MAYLGVGSAGADRAAGGINLWLSNAWGKNSRRWTLIFCLFLVEINVLGMQWVETLHLDQAAKTIGWVEDKSADIGAAAVSQVQNIPTTIDDAQHLVTPSPTPPVLEAGTVWFDAPTGGIPQGNVGGKQFEIVAKYGDDLLAGNVIQIKVKDDDGKWITFIDKDGDEKTAMWWVLRTAIPFDDDKLASLLNGVPDRKP